MTNSHLSHNAVSSEFDTQTALLQEMGIESYQLTKPDALQGKKVERLSLPSDCQLLIIGSQQDIQDESALVNKIVSSMKLHSNLVFCIKEADLARLHPDAVAEWVWSCGIDESKLTEKLRQAKFLRSSRLKELSVSPVAKKQLWLSICEHAPELSKR